MPVVTGKSNVLSEVKVHIATSAAGATGTAMTGAAMTPAGITAAAGMLAAAASAVLAAVAADAATSADQAFCQHVWQVGFGLEPLSSTLHMQHHRRAGVSLLAPM